MKEDILTGFYIREELIPYLNKLINERTPFTVGLIDLDGFKKYNDKYGHAFGDEILKYIASTLKLTIGGTGRIFRLGGDEFLVVFPKRNKRSAINIFKFCNRHLQRRPFLSGNRLYRISASYGIASYPQDADDPKELISLADKAMYFSKKKRRKGSITDVNRIPVIKVRIFVIKFSVLLGIVLLGVYFINNLQKLPPLRLEKLKSTVKRYILNLKTEQRKITPLPQYPVEVTLRNGVSIWGRIVPQDENTLTLEVDFSGRKGRITVDRELVLEVR